MPGYANFDLTPFQDGYTQSLLKPWNVEYRSEIKMREIFPYMHRPEPGNDWNTVGDPGQMH
jgi:hypothetical protein